MVCSFLYPLTQQNHFTSNPLRTGHLSTAVTFRVYFEILCLPSELFSVSFNFSSDCSFSPRLFFHFLLAPLKRFFLHSLFCYSKLLSSILYLFFSFNTFCFISVFFLRSYDFLFSLKSYLSLFFSLFPLLALLKDFCSTLSFILPDYLRPYRIFLIQNILFYIV